MLFISNLSVEQINQKNISCLCTKKNIADLILAVCSNMYYPMSF